MNHLPTFTPLSANDLEKASGGYSSAIFTGPGCILYVPGYPKENPVVPGPSAGIED